MKYCDNHGAPQRDAALPDRCCGANVPTSAMPALLACILALALCLGGCTGRPAAGDTNETPGSGSAAAEIPLPEETPASPAPASPPPAASGEDGPSPMSQPVTTEMAGLVPASKPWQGAWVNAKDSDDFFVFENVSNVSDTPIDNGDGSYFIYRARLEDNALTDAFLFERSDEREMLTRMDAAGDLVGYYVRPTYDRAPSPLPTEDWGMYTLVTDYTQSEENPEGTPNPFGPFDVFMIDAFRFGSRPYQRLVDNGGGSWTCACDFPEGENDLEVNFRFEVQGDDLYMTIYDTAGNARYLYVLAGR